MSTTLYSLWICIFYVTSAIYQQRPIDPTYYIPKVPTLHLNDDGSSKPNINNWSTTGYIIYIYYLHDIYTYT